MKQTVDGEELFLWRQQAKESAQAANVDSNEVDWLLQALTGLHRLFLRLESFRSQSSLELPYSLTELSALWQRRLCDRIPVQYLVGETPWRNFTLKVTPDVLIPRPETEYLIDIAINAVKQSPNADLTHGHWLDLGTGSGAIALALADSFPNATIHAVDRSAAALAVAQENAQRYGFDPRIQFYLGSWWSPLAELKGKVSAMLSNPPYIPRAMIADLQPEVARHEPIAALDGGSDGLDAIRYLIATAPNYLDSGGIILLEMMAGQGEAVSQLMVENGHYDNIQVIEDLAKCDRFILAYRH